MLCSLCSWLLCQEPPSADLRPLVSLGESSLLLGLCRLQGSRAVQAEIRQGWPRQQEHSALPFMLLSPLRLAQGSGEGWSLS